jgi:hypothetical protein
MTAPTANIKIVPIVDLIWIENLDFFTMPEFVFKFE